MRFFFAKANLLRVTALLIAAVMLLSASSCGNGKPSDIVSGTDSSLTQLPEEDIPETLVKFLSTFSDWYITEEGTQPQFDSASAGDGTTNILRSIVGNMPCVDWESYPVQMYEDFWDTKNLDPKKWAKNTGGCYMAFDQAGAEWIAVNIFNVTDEDIAAMREQGEKNEWFYLSGEKYYVPSGGVGDPLTDYKINSVKTDGKKYFVDYQSWFLFDDPDNRDFNASYYAELTLKNIDGKEYWSLCKFAQTSGNS